jgi:hypothetical protein
VPHSFASFADDWESITNSPQPSHPAGFYAKSLQIQKWISPRIVLSGGAVALALRYSSDKKPTLATEELYRFTVDQFNQSRAFVLE